jgi:hypothetical protein
MSKIETKLFSREPEVYKPMFGGPYIMVNGKKYDIVRRSGNDKKWIVRETDAVFNGAFAEEFIVEETWSGEWKMRKKGWSESV